VHRALAVEERKLAATTGRALRLALVALRSGDGVEQVRVGLQSGPGREGLAVSRVPGGVVRRQRRRARRMMPRRVEDVADLDRVGAQVRGRLADVDLLDVSLHGRSGQVADDLGLELVMEDVRGKDGTIVGER